MVCLRATAADRSWWPRLAEACVQFTAADGADCGVSQGDSGGPLLVASAGGGYTLEGVVSFGYGCGRPGYYGVYQRVAGEWPRAIRLGCRYLLRRETRHQ